MSRRFPDARAAASKSAMLGGAARATLPPTLKANAAAARLALRRRTLIRLRKIGSRLGGFAAGRAEAAGVVERSDDSRRRCGRRLDGSFALGTFAPNDVDQA